MKRQFDKRAFIVANSPRLRQAVSRTWQAEKKEPRPSIGKRIIRLFTGKRILKPWELKAKAEAVAKRARRRERNIRWWSNDRTWRVA